VRSAGFSVIEFLVAMALRLTVAAVAIALVDPASFDVQLESADMQQRVRVAAGALY
jgi:Tfp pilus assembly protein PilW